jgi:hypothetical protein
MFNRQSLNPGEAVTLGAGPVEVKVLKRALVVEQLLVGLAVVKCRLA